MTTRKSHTPPNMRRVTLQKVDGNREKTFTIQLPTHWGELTRPQVWVVADLLLSPEPFKAKFELLKHMIAPSVFRYLDEFQISELGNCLDFLFESDNLTKNQFPKFKTFFGPTDMLSKTTLSEYARADTHFRKFIKTQNIKELDLLVACLYRPSKRNIHNLKRDDKWSGDCRQAYNPDKVQENAKLIAKLPHKFKCATFLFFVGCKQKFVEMFKDIFPQNPPKNSKEGSWADTKLDLAEAGIFGDLNATGETYILNALAFLNKKAKEAKEAEKQ